MLVKKLIQSLSFDKKIIRLSMFYKLESFFAQETKKQHLHWNPTTPFVWLFVISLSPSQRGELTATSIYLSTNFTCVYFFAKCIFTSKISIQYRQLAYPKLVRNPLPKFSLLSEMWSTYLWKRLCRTTWFLIRMDFVSLMHVR